MDSIVEKFWMIVRLDGPGAERTYKRHYSEQDAIDEVARLCRKERATFVLLEATHTCTFPEPDLEWAAIEDLELVAQD